MEQKLTEILKKILANPDLIGQTYRSENEYYFRFKEVAMSIFRAFDRDAKFGPYSFYIYPKWNDSLEDLAHISSLGNLEEADMDMISYHIGQCKDSEASKYFEPLFKLMQKKHSKIDIEDVFRKILE
jgi:hypothetical protein